MKVLERLSRGFEWWHGKSWPVQDIFFFFWGGGVWGLGFRVSGLGFGVQGLGPKV